MTVRGGGRLYLPTYRSKTGELKHASIWWFEINARGTKFRASTGIRGGSPGKPPWEAREYLARKRAECGRGQLSLDRLTWDHLSIALLADREAIGLKSLVHYNYRIRPINAFFGGVRAEHIVDERDPKRTVAAYIVHRRHQGAAISTINLELGLIRQAFKLAIQKGKLNRGPLIRTVPGAHVRQGFLEDGEFRAILAGMPDRFRPIAEALRLTGWREGEMVRLQWSNVDWDNQLLRLEAGTTKNGDGRVFPFGDYPPLLELLTRQRARKDEIAEHVDVIAPWVFTDARGGQITKPAFYRAWYHAREKVGSKRVPHDLRRTFARGGVMAGIDEGTLMALGGWKTRSMFQRYAIKDVAALRRGVAMLAETSSSQPAPARLVAFEAPEARLSTAQAAGAAR